MKSSRKPGLVGIPLGTTQPGYPWLKSLLLGDCLTGHDHRGKMFRDMQKYKIIGSFIIILEIIGIIMTKYEARALSLLLLLLETRYDESKT